MSAVGLRPATPADSEFCFGLHRAAAREYVEAVRGWDEATQRALHERGFKPSRTRIITVDGRDVGTLSVEYRPTAIYLVRIEIEPAGQGQGVGSRLIQALLDEAVSSDRAVLLDVLVVNHRARALYERLGFREVTTRHGERDLKIRMCWTAPTPRRSGPPP